MFKPLGSPENAERAVDFMANELLKSVKLSQSVRLLIGLQLVVDLDVA